MGGVENIYNHTSMERSCSARLSGVSSSDFQTMFHKLFSVEHDELARSNLTTCVEIWYGSTQEKNTLLLPNYFFYIYSKRVFRYPPSGWLGIMIPEN